MPIFVINVEGKTLALDVEATYTIHELKSTIKVKEGILGATHECVVATGASGLRKAMDNAGMETRDARVGEAQLQ